MAKYLGGTDSQQEEVRAELMVEQVLFLPLFLWLVVCL